MADFKERLIKEKLSDILGQEKVKQMLKSALLVDRHIVIIGPPGVGKTTIAKNVARILPNLTVNDCGFNCLPDSPACPSCINGETKKTTEVTGDDRFIRVQGSPDLTAEDLLGDIDPIKALKFGPLSAEAFTPGKIFKANNGILFFDELNRCPEKLQNALLQVLSEGHATIGSYDVDFRTDFIFIATMNPEDTNTEQLSDVLLDRFDAVNMSYPESSAIEEEIVRMKGQQLVEVPHDVLNLMVSYVRSLRADKNLEKVPSVRASIGLFERAQAHAKLNGRNKVKVEDMTAVLESVISHRIKLKPSFRLLKNTKEFLREEYEDLLKKLRMGADPQDTPRHRKGDSA